MTPDRERQPGAGRELGQITHEMGLGSVDSLTLRIGSLGWDLIPATARVHHVIVSCSAHQSSVASSSALGSLVMGVGGNKALVDISSLGSFR